MVKLIKKAKAAQVGFHRAFPLWLFNRQPASGSLPQDRVLDRKIVAQLIQLRRDVKEDRPVGGEGKKAGPTLTPAETGNRLTLTWA